jgi:uncharacterized membrane protein YjjP (DUF1212 family)
MARKSAAVRSLPMYKRIFFDRMLMSGVIFLSLAYLLYGTWGGAFSEAVAFMIGIVWSVRAATTNPNVVFRLAAALILVLLGSLLALKLGAANGLI